MHTPSRVSKSCSTCAEELLPETASQKSLQLQTKLHTSLPALMASTSGSSEVKLKKFKGTNFNFTDKDYLMMFEKIDPIKNEFAPMVYKRNE
jgi:hypothetical protein